VKNPVFKGEKLYRSMPPKKKQRVEVAHAGDLVTQFCGKLAGFAEQPDPIMAADRRRVSWLHGGSPEDGIRCDQANFCYVTAR